MSTDTAVASEPLVLSSRDGGVVRLRLNRGNRFNPLSLEMIAAIQAELDAIAGDPAARVVVLAAEGQGLLRGPRPEGDAGARGRRGLAAAALRRLQPDDGGA